jgi:hypothetical protein
MEGKQMFRSLIAGCIFAGWCAGIQTALAEESSAGKGVKFPFIVFDEKGSTNNHYVPSGWMGNTKGIRMDEAGTVNPHGGKTCLRFEYSEPADWAGVVWQDPPNDWGDQPGGWNLTGAKKLKFWARGDKGGETVSFKFGVLGLDKKYSDSSTGTTGPIKLAKEWTEYSIDLAGKDLSRIKTGFVWTLDGQGSPIIFFLDDIRFE